MTRGDVAVGLACLAVIVFVVWVLWSVNYQSNYAPCEELGWMTQKNLPSRCIEYWSGR